MAHKVQDQCVKDSSNVWCCKVGLFWRFNSLTVWIPQ